MHFSIEKIQASGALSVMEHLSLGQLFDCLRFHFSLSDY